MKRPIKRIAVPVDFTEISQNAVDAAVALAIKLKADLVLLHIIHLNGYQFAVVPEMKSRLLSQEEYERAVITKLEEIRDDVKKKYGIHAAIHLGHGHVDSEIIDYCVRNDVDMIVMGTHGASGLREIFIGSNAQRVITLSPFPVLTVHDKKGASGFRSILLPIDDSVHSREKVNIAVSIAQAFGSMIKVVGLPDSTDEKGIAKFRIKLDSVEKIIRAAGVPFESSIVNGDNVAQTALKYAGMNNCDLIVINTGHESKLTGVFLGGFAQQIINHSRIPVLSVKHLHGEYGIETVGFGIS